MFCTCENKTKEHSFYEDHGSYLFRCGSGRTGGQPGASSAASSTASSAASSEAVSSVAASGEAVSEASDAKIKAQFTVTGADGESQTFDLEATDGEKLSDALAEAGIISEDEAAAGFVTTVNGETADWDKDAAWWCLTDASGEMTAVGVADIQLHDGDSYAFTYTK